MQKLKIEDFKKEIKEIIELIHLKKIHEILNRKLNGRVKINDLKRVIKEYGCEVVPIPNNVFELVESYFVEKTNTLDVFIPLWTKEEGRSDLTLSLICRVRNGEKIVEISDLRVQ